METLKVSELKDHPRNHEFFDDMSGSKWRDFLDSVKNSGVIEPVVITTDKVIVSGHQRVRACRELNIAEVPCIMTDYASDDPRCVKDLIETNVRQRGNPGGTDEQILARVNALKEYYGITRGGDRKSEAQKIKSARGTFDRSVQTTVCVSEICERAGTTPAVYKKAQQLARAIPETRELIEEGVVSPKAVRTLIAKLSPDEQRELVDMLPKPEEGKHVTTPEVQEYIDKLHAKEAELKEKSKELKAKNDELKAKDSELAEVRDELTESEKQRQHVIESRDYYMEADESNLRRINELRAEIGHQKRQIENERLNATNWERRYTKLNNDIDPIKHGVADSIDGVPLPLKVKLDEANATISVLKRQLAAANDGMPIPEVASVVTQGMSQIQRDVLTLQGIMAGYVQELAGIVKQTDEKTISSSYGKTVTEILNCCNAALERWKRESA